MKKSMLLAVCATAAGALFAETTPVMVSLFTPVQAPASSYDVTGLRLSLIYGDCQEFTGLDIGIVNHAAGGFTGLGVGGANVADGTVYGVQLGLLNWNGNGATDWANRSVGGQLGIVNYADSFCGLQDGFLNISGEMFSGLQYGLVNVVDDVRGVQCGYWVIFGVNIASGHVRGCQFGLVNYADTMESGLQIGLVNIISNNGWLPVLPIVNGHF